MEAPICLLRPTARRRMNGRRALNGKKGELENDLHHLVCGGNAIRPVPLADGPTAETSRFRAHPQPTRTSSCNIPLQLSSY